MAVEFPRCAVCRVHVQAGQNVVFRPDGRVSHVACPPVICSVCSRSIRPDEPIRRDGEGLVHGNCWVRRYRTERRAVESTAPAVVGVAAMIRERIAAGTLPAPRRAGETAWGGPGSGAPCAGCDRGIPSTAVECEVEVAGQTLRFHRACLAAWQAEAGPGPAAIGGGSAAGPATVIFDQRVARRARRERRAYEELLLATAETQLLCEAVRARSAVARARSCRLRAASERLRKGTATTTAGPR
jgi:hypothetical protein